MKLIGLLPLLFLFVISSLRSQTYHGTGGPLADDNTYSDFVITVSDLLPATLTPQHGLKRVCINLTHTWVSDLDIRLIAPDGTNMMLSAVKGDDLDNYENTCFDMDASEHIITAVPPFTGDFKPFSSLGNANNGSSGLGNWTLRIFDQYAFADSGEMLDWSLSFGEDASAPIAFDSTSLPIVVLSTDNVTIPNEPKIPGYFKLIDNGDGFNKLSDIPVFESFIGIEVRGASSQSFPKKSFGFETQDELGNDLEISLLDMPGEEDWILYAPYTDKSLLRDALTYKLGNDMGRYAPRTQFVELVLNGDYHGVYALEEKIKRDKNRVDIAKLTPADTIGDEVTGGYILKIDRDDGPGTYFVSNYEGTDTAAEVRVVYEDPKGPELHPLQHAYIQDFYHKFEAALYGDDFKDELLGYRRYIDVGSFIDFFIVSELGHNVDAYRLSTYMYKDRDSKDSLLHLGPLWDFNLAYGNANYCESQLVEGWAYRHSGACGNTPLWWPRLLEDEYFQNEVKCRYTELRENIMSDAAIFHYIDSMANALEHAAERNFERWPVLGIYIWPNNFIGQTFAEEIDYMKDWIAGRLNWMDENIPGECIVATEDAFSTGFRIVPNPATDEVAVDCGHLPYQISVMDINGKVLLKETFSQSPQSINVANLLPGTYVVQILSEGKEFISQKLVIIR